MSQCKNKETGKIFDYRISELDKTVMLIGNNEMLIGWMTYDVFDKMYEVL